MLMLQTPWKRGPPDICYLCGVRRVATIVRIAEDGLVIRVCLCGECGARESREIWGHFMAPRQKDG